MARLQPVRGTHDILGDKAIRFRTIFEIFKAIAERYSHHEIDTPIFEFTETFKRTLGETSDVVSKEMYTFEDRSGEEITLRPEYTAGIARAFMSNGLQQSMPCKFYSFGPIFRYERPQKGRMRQFHQMDIEILGVEEPQADIEVLAIASDLLNELGIGEHITLELNSLGDPESRIGYRDALVEYFTGFKDKLSEDSLKRLDKNPMRILDSKDEGDRELVANAPRIADYYNDHTKDFFKTVIDGVEALGIKYVINDRLVRGLDYYCHTAFEFTTDQLGAQGTVLAGGRYDGLMEMMGGPKTAGIGWAAGMERLSELISEDLLIKPNRPVVVTPVGADAQTPAVKVAHDLRSSGIVVDMAYKGNVGKRMKRANKQNARFAVLLGEEELARNVAMVKNLDEGSQEEVSLDVLSEYIKGNTK
ncbi:histidine--tRNA ligase [Pseudemcibacter aquimaris]|uniref:histidine--tRNA ligase n=1 Tax=Pseudemcibacter aquimaris TaxID=2857064 RepID=UPI002012E496|nr:histidine--tRNA ligase [Pseudemcibacter aquimaris]MCC3861792.1 histidine--tRNA ligase [Pseudemcibacter aquimaris]WDU58547.1 histidine--tRNA ligase [Pseudemcibacter aquimaris]